MEYSTYVCMCVGGSGFKDWRSEPERVVCGFLSGQRAVVHHVLTFPASVSYFCRDTTADDPEHSRFNTEGFNLAQCWTPTVACNSPANAHAWNNANYTNVCFEGKSLWFKWPKIGFSWCSVVWRGCHNNKVMMKNYFFLSLGQTRIQGKSPEIARRQM